MDLSQFSDQDLEALSSGSMGKLSDQALETLANQPRKDYASEKPQKPEHTGLEHAQAMAEGIGQGGWAFGHLPHIQAAAEPATDQLFSNPQDPNDPVTVDQKLKAQGFLVQSPDDDYTHRRDKNIERLERTAKEMPKSYYGGQLLGAAGTGLGMSKAASGLLPKAAGVLYPTAQTGMLARGVQTAGAAAGQGFLQNPGDEKGKLNPIQWDERVGQAESAAKFGGGLSAAGSILAKAPKVAAKVSHALNGLPEQDIKTYAAATDEVNALIRKSGGDMTEAADLVRGNLQTGLRTTRQKFSKQITDALKESSQDRTIDPSPITKKLEELRDRMDPVYGEESIQEVKAILEKVNKKAVDGRMSLRDLFETKEYLQDQAKSSYMKGGQLFSRGRDAQKAAKQAAAEARKTLNGLSPEIAEANNRLSMLHDLEDKLNKNLITPGKTESALLAAGSGGNKRNAKMLERMGELTDMDALGEARKLSAARSFGNVSLMPADSTGKAAARIATGGGIGAATGGLPGAIVGGILTSPATTKGLINAGNIAGKVKRSLPGSKAAGGLLKAVSGSGGAKAGLLRATDQPKTTESKEDSKRRQLGKKDSDRKPAGGKK